MRILFLCAFAILTGCSTIVNEAHVPMNLSFSDNSAGECSLWNKRERYKTEIPKTILIRRSDDPLVYECTTSDGRPANGKIISTIGDTIAGNAGFSIFWPIGAAIDADTDKHREYPGAFAIPVVKK